MLTMYYGHTNPPRFQDAARAAMATLAIRPTSHVALIDAADTLAYIARYDEAAAHAMRALEVRPDLMVTHLKLYFVYAGAGQERDALQTAERAAARFPDSPHVLLVLGYAQSNSRRWADAERTLRKALAAHPGYAPLHLALASVLTARGLSAEAEAAIREAVRLGSGHTYHEIEIGQAYAQLGLTEPAVAAFRAALDRAPGSPDACAGLASVLTAAERYPEAIEAARKAVQMNPQSSYARGTLAYTLRLSGENNEALEHAREAVRLLPTNTFAHGEVGLCLENLKRFAEAEVAFRAMLAINPDKPDSQVNLGRVLRLKGDSRAAVEFLYEGLARSQANATTHREFGEALWGTKQPEAAVIAYREATRLDPKWSTPHNDMGIVLESLGRHAEALAEYEAAVALNPTDAVIRTNYGKALVRHGKKTEAEAAFRTAISNRSTYGAAYKELFDLLYTSTPRRELEAGVVATLWAQVEPASTTPHNSLANALYSLGMYEAAATSYRRAVELAPKDSVLHQNLAGAFRQLRRYGEAADEYRKAWDLNPTEGEYPSKLIRSLTLAESFDAAEKVAVEAVEKLPRDPGVRAAIGALRLARKNPAGAEAEMRRAIELGPTVADYYADLARLLADAGRSGEAVAVLRRGVERTKSGTSLTAQLVSALYVSGHPDEAVAVATSALAARPGDFATLRFRGRAHFDVRDYDASITDLTAALKAAEGRTDITSATRATTLLWLAQAQYRAGRYPDALASARASERFAPGAFAATLAAEAADALRFEARADAIKSGSFRPKDSAGKVALATYLVVENRELALAYELFAEALDANPKLAEDRSALHRYYAARAAAAGTGRHARAFGWLFAEWATTPLDTRARRAGIWLRDPLLASVRDDTALDALPWLQRCGWRLFWGDLRRATELPSMKD